MPDLDVDGTTVHYELHRGPGPVLTLIHGGWLDSRAWKQHGRALSSRCTVLAPDLGGYGRSTSPAEPWSVGSWASDLLGLWDALDIQHSYLLGFSMGGLVALDIAQRAPERVNGLVLVSTTARFDEEVREAYRRGAESFDEASYDAALARHVEVAFAPSFREQRPKSIAAYEKAARTTPLSSVRKTMLALADADYVDSLERFDAPALVVHGSEDRVTGGHHPERLVALLPDVRERVIEGGGHTLHLEQPGQFIRTVSEFIDETERARA